MHAVISHFHQNMQNNAGLSVQCAQQRPQTEFQEYNNAYDIVYNLFDSSKFRNFNAKCLPLNAKATCIACCELCVCFAKIDIDIDQNWTPSCMHCTVLNPHTIYVIWNMCTERDRGRVPKLALDSHAMPPYVHRTHGTHRTCSEYFFNDIPNNNNSAAVHCIAFVWRNCSMDISLSFSLLLFGIVSG